MKNFLIETDHTIVVSDRTGLGKEVSFNNHPTVPLYTVTAETGARSWGCKTRLVGRYSKLEDAMAAYEKIS